MKKFYLAIIFIVFLIKSFAANVNVNINYNSEINSFSPFAAFSINTGEWNGYSLLKSNIWKFQYAGFHFIRFPGGSNSNEYHWNGNGQYVNDIWVVNGTPSPTIFLPGFMNLSKYRGSTSAGYRKKAMVTDNDLTTSWKSFEGAESPQWIYLEIQNSSYQPVPVNRIVIDWGTPYATQYKVQYSNANWPGTLGVWVYNDTAWTDTSLGIQSGSGGSVDLMFNTVNAKYVRVLCLSSSGNNTYEIKEIKLYYGNQQISVNTDDPLSQTKTVSSSVALGDKFDYYGNMDFEQFMDICKSLKPPAEPLITVNFFTGTTQEAADWVYYANVFKNYNIKYWEIGNENAGNWEAGGPVNSQFYAKRFLDFYDAMTAIDPSIIVMPQFNYVLDIANVTMNASNNPQQWDYYIESFLKYLQQQGRINTIKAISIHRYPTWQPANEATVLSNTDIWDTELTSLKNWINTYCQNPQNVSIWLTEYNDGIDSAFTNRYYNSLFISAYILNYLKNGGDYGFLFTDFGTPGPGQMAPDIFSDFGALEGGGLTGNLSQYRYQPRASFWALYILKNKFSAADELGNTLVASSSTNSYLKVYANKRGDSKLSIALINTHNTEEMNVTISIANFLPLQQAEVVTFSPQNYSWIENGYMSYANPDTQPEETIINYASQNFTFTVPAYNIKILTLYDSTKPTLTPSFTPTQLPTPTMIATPIIAGGVMVDDCEDGDNINLWNGKWAIYGDGVSIYPTQIVSMDCSGGYNSNCYLKVTGYVASNSWGFGVNCPLSPNWMAVDISQYDGLFFCYKGDGLPARVYINQRDFPGYGYYGYDFNSTTNWAYFQIPFLDLTQPPWSTTPGVWDPTKAQAISFQCGWGEHQAFIGVDNVGFYKNTPTFTPTLVLTLTPVLTPDTHTEERPAENLKNVKAFPTLCDAKKNCNAILFSGLTEDIIFSLYNINGELVYKIKLKTYNGKFLFNLENTRKKKISSGIYTYIIQNNKGETAKGKIVIKK